MPKVFISPERRPKPHGAYAAGGVYEHDICNEIGELVKKRLEYNGFIVMLETNPNVLLSQRVEAANKSKCDYYMAIHTNAGGGTGTECLHDGKNDSKKANQLIYDELTKLYPSKRGIKDYSHFYENNMTNMVSCYPEIAFHDNKSDATFILNNKAQIASAIAKGTCAYFRVIYKEPATNTPANKPLYGVAQQVLATSSKEKAEEYAKKLNKEEGGENAYFKVIEID